MFTKIFVFTTLLASISAEGLSDAATHPSYNQHQHSVRYISVAPAITKYAVQSAPIYSAPSQGKVSIPVVERQFSVSARSHLNVPSGLAKVALAPLPHPIPVPQYAAAPVAQYSAAPIAQYSAAPIQYAAHYAAIPTQQYAAAPSPVAHYAGASAQQYAAAPSPIAHYAAAPIQQYAAAPSPVAHYAAAPAQQYAAAPSPVAHYAAAPATQYAAAPAPVVKYAAAPAPQYAQYAAESSDANHHQEEYAHPAYEYGYTVEDHHTGDIHSQQEHRDGKRVVGQYSLHEADGTVRIVKYHDEGHGFNAVVERQGTPTEAPVHAKNVVASPHY